MVAGVNIHAAAAHTCVRGPVLLIYGESRLHLATKIELHRDLIPRNIS